MFLHNNETCLKLVIVVKVIKTTVITTNFIINFIYVRGGKAQSRLSLIL